MINPIVLQDLKLKLNSADVDDARLLVLLKQAESIILNHIYPTYTTIPIDSVPARYESRELEIAEYLYNRMGSEGQTGHSENGISRNYESGSVPSSMLKGILQCIKVVGLDA